MTLKTTRISHDELIELTEVVLNLRNTSYSGNIKNTSLSHDNPLINFSSKVNNIHQFNKIKMEIGVCSTIDCVSKYTKRVF